MVTLNATTVSPLRLKRRIALLRETKDDVVFVSRLRAALARLNPALPPEAITAAANDLTGDRSTMSLAAANREVYLLLKEGSKESVPDHPSLSHRTYLSHVTALSRRRPGLARNPRR